MKSTLAAICLLAVLIPSSRLIADDDDTRGGESSPFTVGAWKLVCNDTACQSPVLDTEFRFINPTPLTLTLEYAFFENDGTFCGCDRDALPANKTLSTPHPGKGIAAPV